MIKFTFFILLFGFWFLLSAQLNGWMLGLGIASAGLVVLLSQRLRLLEQRKKYSWGRLVRLPFYGLRLFGRIVLANLDVAWRLVQPEPPIKPATIRLASQAKSPLKQLIQAHSITLTPGTITTYIGDHAVEVHVLHQHKKTEHDLIKIDQELSRL